MRNGWFRELVHYRELFFFMVWRDLKIRYKQTALGALWAVVQPAFLMIVITLVIGLFRKMPDDALPGPIFYYSAVLPWTYFSVALGFSGNSLVMNANLIRKVYFPRAILPISSSIGGLVDFAVASLLLAALLFYFRIAFTWETLLWPLLVLPLVLFTVGVSMFLSALNVRYRDVKYMIPAGLQLLFFGSPILWELDAVPERFRIWLTLNPLCGFIEASRASLHPGRTIDWTIFGLSLVVTALLLVFGTFYFRKVERGFADVI